MCSMCAQHTQKSEWHFSHHTTSYQIFPIRWPKNLITLHT
jgi:hypothetical protein